MHINVGTATALNTSMTLLYVYYKISTRQNYITFDYEHRTTFVVTKTAL